MGNFLAIGPLRRLWQVGRWLIPLLVILAIIYKVRTASILVDAVHPVRQSIVAEVMGTGTLEARVATTISPKISGRIREVFVDQGERVSQNRLLVELDDEELTQQVAIAEANVDAARAAFERLRADKARALAVFEQAERYQARTKSLRESNALSQDELDRATESLAIASADIARAEAAIVEGSKAMIAAEKTLAYHQARLADTRIHASFDGMIVARNREAGDIAVPGSAILTLISTDVLWVSAWVDETQMATLAVDQPARVVFRSEPNRDYSGTVARLGRQADRETREFVVDVQVDELPANWAVGQRAEVYIQTASKHDVLTIPAEFLARQAGDAGVFVAEDQTARWRVVQLGLRGAENVEVIDGLSDSDQVLRTTKGTTPLTDGQAIKMP